MTTTYREGTMTPDEFIAKCHEVAHEINGTDRLAELLIADELLPWLEDVQLNGFADEQTGDVDAPDGHIYRVDRWTVRTDTRGFRLAEDHGSAEKARAIFSAYEGAYADWLDDPTLDRDE